MMRHAFPLGAVLGLFTIAVVQPAAAAPQSSPVPGLSSAGHSIARATDGTMWVTEPASPGRLARIALDGTVTEYTGGVTPNFTPSRAPDGITITPDGYVWFLMHGGNDEVGRVSMATGAVFRYQLTNGTPTSIAAGPDGRLWMTAKGDSGGTDFLARYNRLDNTTLSYASGLTAQTKPRSLTPAADGNLWFVEEGSTGRVGQVDADGAVTFRGIGGAPTALGAGPGGMWFSRGTELGLIGTDSTSLFDTGNQPGALAAGPDDAIWSVTGSGGVARVGPDGIAQTHPIGLDPSAKGTGIAAGPDGRMWMTLDRSPFLVRITVPPRVGSAAGEATSPTTATVTTEIRPNGLPTTASIQRRTASGAWTTLSESAVGDALTSAPVRFEVAGLAAGTRNELRVVATNDAGPAITAEIGVQTAPAPVVVPEPEPEPVPSTPVPSTPVPSTPAPSTPVPVGTTPAPTAESPTASPAPVQGATVVVRSDRGTVTYKVPGSDTSRPIDGAASIPTGSIIDTTKGAVLLSSQVGDASQQGLFYGGEFKVKQVKKTGMTQLHLRGELDCAAPAKGKAVKAAKKKKRRHVWGEDKNGRFETHGKDSVATVRGTRWLTTDTCGGTVVKVYEGAVSVKPVRGKGKAVLVKAGGRHVTRPKR